MMTDEQQTPYRVARNLAAIGLARWPGLAVDVEALAKHLVDAPGAGPGTPALAAERYLAFACATGVPKAALIFQELYAEAIEGGARSVDASSQHVEEVRQRVLELLFVGSPPGNPKIAQYKGQGPLGAWVRTTAKRVALRIADGARANQLTVDDALASELADSCDQELALLRAHYSSVFREALSGALRELPSEDRMLLQMSIVGGISTVRLAKMYQLNQSTISRRIQRAAGKTFDVVRQRLRADLGIADNEVESLLAIVRSHIEMTLSCFDE